jgi:4-phospho-D-threonate 3-dehydrogenase / 4-phospho-D-erythronate 3-dehydrogenase
LSSFHKQTTFYYSFRYKIEILSENLKKIGITVGDIAGIGPEVVLKAVSDTTLQDFCVPVIIGDARFLTKTAKDLSLPSDFLIVKNDGKIPETSDKTIIYDLANVNETVELGKESAIAGKVSAEYIETAVKLCQANEIDAISTAPINKKSLSLGGYAFQGHTEFLAYLTDTKEFAMSFFAGEMCVVLLSTHLSLIDALKLVKKDKLVDLIKLTHRETSFLLGRKPKIAVAGVNPHASEGGLFGDEENDEMIPAIVECRQKFEIDVQGAFSADTVFLRGFRGEFDAIISCYHDQATIAVKCLSFGESVNVTLGLPFVRTSVDHGTAFDIAGKNLAESSSMKTAIKLAAKLSKNYSKR